MIRVQRGPEPRGLRTARTNRLPKATAAFEKGVASELKKLLAGGYNTKPTKRALWECQNKKCVWCEARTPFSGHPVDHFRPKDGAHRHLPGEQKRSDNNHYWWLAWTWENLFFSCVSCNDNGHKGNYFPLVQNTSPSEIQGSVSKESPMLLDPTTDDPLDHIEWRPVDRSPAKDEWCWTPHGRTKRGTETIRILKLAERSDEVASHLRTHLLVIKHMEDAIGKGNTPQAHKLWCELLNDCFNTHKSFHAASYCALNIWFPLSQRNGFRELVRP